MLSGSTGGRDPGFLLHSAGRRQTRPVDSVGCLHPGRQLRPVGCRQLGQPARQNAQDLIAKPGYLGFFGTARNTHHVGIYLGNDKMANAPYTGANARTDPVSSHSDLVGYYTLGS
ncbi:NlpC/P60 family protein [Arthrobacter russicus]|uniref:NlpC/P60 family protein n=1 Tax=Arthrobacter russicus TaxID=172040 RepID=UPI00286C70AE|nr:NlpC/P60 family protein [Arthrobacter russicus]